MDIYLRVIDWFSWNICLNFDFEGYYVLTMINIEINTYKINQFTISIFRISRLEAWIIRWKLKISIEDCFCDSGDHYYIFEEKSNMIIVEYTFNLSISIYINLTLWYLNNEEEPIPQIKQIENTKSHQSQRLFYQPPPQNKTASIHWHWFFCIGSKYLCEEFHISTKQQIHKLGINSVIYQKFQYLNNNIAKNNPELMQLYEDFFHRNFTKKGDLI